jgi:hypothetical protein
MDEEDPLCVFKIIQAERVTAQGFQNGDGDMDAAHGTASV